MKKQLLAALMASVMLTGCAAGGGDTAKKDPTKKEVVTVWAWDKNFNIPVMEEAAKIYEAAHPNVDIQVVDYARQDIEQKLHAGLSTGSTKNLPDVVLIEDYTAQKFLTSYNGLFADLTSSGIDYSKFAQYKVKPMTVDGKTYGVPFDSGVSALFYRTDYLEKAGYKAADLENITWQQFIKIGQDVKAKTGKYIVSENLNEMSGFTRMMMQSAGQWYFDEKGNVTISNNPAMQEAFDVISQFKKTDIIKNTNGWDQWVKSFNDGSVASVVSGSWIMASIQAGKDQSGKWGVAPMPRLSLATSKNASNLGGSSWYVLEGKDAKATATDFMKTVYAGNDEFYQTILTKVGAIGTYIPAQSGAAYKQTSEFFGGQDVFQKFSQWMQQVPQVNYGTYVSEADAAVHAVMPDLVGGKVTTKDALTKVEAQVKNQIN